MPGWRQIDSGNGLLRLLETSKHVGELDHGIGGDARHPGNSCHCRRAGRW